MVFLHTAIVERSRVSAQTYAPRPGGSKVEARSMTVSAAQLAFAQELFDGLAGLSSRRMFGGAGLYAEGVMFALVDDDVIYLKTDPALREALVAEGSRPWVYAPIAKGRETVWPQETRYWSLPEAALDDPEDARAWAERAVAAALAAQVAKRRTRT
jgi:DNA transformation protein